ncbi:hypothetical protein GQ55_8G105200 [Panicum hallii var. hallii]|uniref:Uncharacterized protein n=1 Tax=Panicum hallii var. hallii TaxID=1504633 RepID=A0A2T7CME8_9POAL|nr:hypothetical protein GQ55_8G105200 [Panicum hallii var. hallii]
MGAEAGDRGVASSAVAAAAAAARFGPGRGRSYGAGGQVSEGGEKRSLRLRGWAGCIAVRSGTRKMLLPPPAPTNSGWRRGVAEDAGWLERERRRPRRREGVPGKALETLCSLLDGPIKIPSPRLLASSASSPVA